MMSLIDRVSRLDLLQTIQEEAEHLNRIIKNVLDMTRLESGAIKVNKEWQSLEEIVGAVLNRLGRPPEGSSRDRKASGEPAAHSL